VSRNPLAPSTLVLDVLVSRVLRAGRRLGFTQVEIKRAADGVVIASGTHTKAL